VEVKLVEAHPSAGALRFQLVSEGRYDLKLARGKGAIARRQQQRPSFGPRGRRRR
jgi:ribonuclease R